MPQLWTKTIGDGAKNLHLQVNGELEDGDIPWTKIVTTPPAYTLRLDDIYYAISDKAEVFLAWHSEEEDNRHVFLPLSGRGRLNFVDVGIYNTVSKGCTGDVEISAESPLAGARYFLLILKFSKQGV